MIDLVICQGGQSGRFYILRIQHQLRFIASSINCPSGPIWLCIHLRLSVCWKYRHSFAITPSLLDNCINHWCWLVKYISTYGCVLSHCILVTSHLFSLVPSETCLYVNLFTSGKYLVFYPGQVNSKYIVKFLVLCFTANWCICGQAWNLLILDTQWWIFLRSYLYYNELLYHRDHLIIDSWGVYLCVYLQFRWSVGIPQLRIYETPWYCV